MKKDTRRYKLFYLLSDLQEHTAGEISKKLGVSKRTVFNDLNKMDDIFSLSGCTLESRRGRGLKMRVFDVSAYKEFYDHYIIRLIFSSNQNKHDDNVCSFYDILAVMFSAERYLTQDEVADRLYISKNSLTRDFKLVKQILKSYRLEIKNDREIPGMIAGTEFDARMCQMFVYEYYTSLGEKGFKYLQDGTREWKHFYHKMRKIAAPVFQKHHVMFREKSFRLLVKYMELAVNRYRSGRRIERAGGAELLKNCKCYRSVKELSVVASEYLDFSEDENEVLALTVVTAIWQEVDPRSDMAADFGSIYTEADRLAGEIMEMVETRRGVCISKKEHVRAMFISCLIPILFQIKLNTSGYFKYSEKDEDGNYFSYLYAAQIAEEIRSYIGIKYKINISEYNLGRIYSTVLALIREIEIPYNPVTAFVYHKQGIECGRHIVKKLKKELAGYVFKEVSMTTSLDAVDLSKCDFLITFMSGEGYRVNAKRFDMEVCGRQEEAALKQYALIQGYRLSDLYSRIFHEPPQLYDNFKLDSCEHFLKFISYKLVKVPQDADMLEEGLRASLPVLYTNQIAVLIIGYQYTEKAVFEIYRLTKPTYWRNGKVKHIVVISLPPFESLEKVRYFNDWIHVISEDSEAFDAYIDSGETDCLNERIVDML